MGKIVVMAGLVLKWHIFMLFSSTNNQFFDCGGYCVGLVGDRLLLLLLHFFTNWSHSAVVWVSFEDLRLFLLLKLWLLIHFKKLRIIRFSQRRSSDALHPSPIRPNSFLRRHFCRFHLILPIIDSYLHFAEKVMILRSFVPPARLF